MKTTVDSSMIKSIEWEDNTLTLEFNNGSHKYFDVKEQIYHDALAAESIGKFFHANIRGQYITEKVL